MRLVLIALIGALALLAGHARAAQTVLTWDYIAADVTTFGVTGFAIERKAEACAGSALPFAQIGTALAAARTYTDATVVQGKTYCYRVAAVNPGGLSGYSNTTAKTVPFDVPPAPTNLAVQ